MISIKQVVCIHILLTSREEGEDDKSEEVEYGSDAVVSDLEPSPHVQPSIPASHSIIVMSSKVVHTLCSYFKRSNSTHAIKCRVEMRQCRAGGCNTNIKTLIYDCLGNVNGRSDL